MKVSIITATYNSERTVKDTLLSVQQQTYRDIEHIIVDGASTDKTINLLELYGHHGPKISEPDKGIYDAMNKGIAVAGGDIIGILNSDDFYADREVIENVVKAFEDQDCDAVYGDLVYVDGQQSKKVVRKWTAGNYNRRLFYLGWMPPHPTVFIRKEVYEKYGLFNLKFKNSSDYELLLRLMFVKHIKVKYIPQVLVHMRTGGHSTKSFSNRVKAHLEDYKAWFSNGNTPKWYTVPMKPMGKITQFLVGGKINYTNHMVFKGFLQSQPSSEQV